MRDGGGRRREWSQPRSTACGRPSGLPRRSAGWCWGRRSGNAATKWTPRWRARWKAPRGGRRRRGRPGRAGGTSTCGPPSGGSCSTWACRRTTSRSCPTARPAGPISFFPTGETASPDAWAPASASAARRVLTRAAPARTWPPPCRIGSASFMAEIGANVARVRARIAEAAGRGGRRPESVLLVAVTKTVEVDRIREAVACGLRVLGENRVQEARAKAPEVPGAVWHLIGSLQRNKVKEALRLFEVIHSVDTLSLAQEISQRAGATDPTADVLIQRSEERRVGKECRSRWTP